MMKALYARAVQMLKKTLLTVLVILSFMYAMFQGGFVSWFLFYGFIPFWAYPLALSLYPIRKVTVARRFNRSEYSGGDRMTVEVTIRRPRFLPLPFLMVEDFLPDRLASWAGGSQKRMVQLLFRKERTFTYEISEAVRGEHIFPGISVEMMDLLGLYEKAAFISCPHTILIYPDYRRVDIDQLDAFYEQGETASSVRTHGENTIVSGVRNYMPGDRLSWIHWKATARRNEIMTKEFEERKSQDAVVLLDTHPAVQFEELVRFTASIVHTMLLQGIGVAYTSLQKPALMYQVGKGEQQRRKIMYELAKATETNSEPPVDHPAVMLGHMPYIVVSAHLTLELIGKVAALKGSGMATVFLLEEAAAQQQLTGQALAKGIVCRFIPESWDRKEVAERA